jgi:DNA-binding MarR family transcriptional regulator
MMTVMTEERDGVDDHVDRWGKLWADNPERGAETEGALVRMGRILKHLQREDAAVFAHSDLSLEDYKTLHALMIQPYPSEATPAQLAEVVNVTRAAMTSRLDRLDKAELITREVEPQDRRRVVVRPTAAGRAAWERHITEGMARDQRMLSALDNAELVSLNALLRKVMRSFEP